MGKGITIYVLDSGCNIHHPDLAGKVDIMWSAFRDGGVDNDGHGTHVVGTLVSETVGVAPAARVKMLKVFDDKDVKPIDILRGLKHIYHNHKRGEVALLNISISYLNPQARYWLKRLVKIGILPFVAGGNDKLKLSRDYADQKRPYVIVGATDAKGKLWKYTNHGKYVDIYAPGVDVQSCAVGGGYTELSGTSMATPLVCGLGALYASFMQSPNEIKRKLLNDAKGPKKLAYFPYWASIFNR